jgi:hypothetical protein
MKRRVLLLTVLALAATAAVIGVLAATAFGPEGSASAKPTGKETRIRIQPQQDRVACSGDKQAVDIFLDDLQARPSKANPAANEGLAAFQLTLLYDPSVLRVEDASDVLLNPVLADVQTAGGMRAFIPAPVTIDNLEGYVFLGAVGIPQGESFDPAATGIDPVARGEPMLLFTVRFQTVGEGTSKLSVYRPEEASPKAEAMGEQLLDYQAKEYAPVVNTDSSLTVTAGKCAPALPVTPLPTQALPTPFPTPTAPVVQPWQDVTPVPAVDAGRTDCPEGWNAYNDPDGHFSLCYPPGLNVRTGGANPPRQGAVVTIFTPPGTVGPDGIQDDALTLRVRWNSFSNFGLGPPGPATCQEYTGGAYPSLVTSSEFVAIMTEAGNAPTCATTAAVSVGGRQIKSFHGEIPLRSDEQSVSGYLSVSGNLTGPGFSAGFQAWRDILQTLSVETLP